MIRRYDFNDSNNVVEPFIIPLILQFCKELFDVTVKADTSLHQLKLEVKRKMLLHLGQSVAIDRYCLQVFLLHTYVPLCLHLKSTISGFEFAQKMASLRNECWCRKRLGKMTSPCQRAMMSCSFKFSPVFTCSK